MATHPKPRTLHLADGGRFRIGPGTVSVPVHTLPLDPPAVLLHVNRSCGCLVLEADAEGHTPPPIRLAPDRVLEIVNQINADRCTAAIRGERAEPPVELPPTFRSTARHAKAWAQQHMPFMVSEDAAGYPGQTPDTADETLWVKRANGKCFLERVAEPLPGSVVRSFSWEEITPRRAVEWLATNNYAAIPATLHRLARTGGKNEPPKSSRR